MNATFGRGVFGGFLNNNDDDAVDIVVIVGGVAASNIVRLQVLCCTVLLRANTSNHARRCHCVTLVLGNVVDVADLARRSRSILLRLITLIDLDVMVNIVVNVSFSCVKKA